MPDRYFDGGVSKRKRLTPLQGAEAADEGTATGVGGEKRRKTIDEIVDDSVSGNSPPDADQQRKRAGQSTDSNNKY